MDGAWSDGAHLGARFVVAWVAWRFAKWAARHPITKPPRCPCGRKPYVAPVPVLRACPRGLRRGALNGLPAPDSAREKGPADRVAQASLVPEWDGSGRYHLAWRGHRKVFHSARAKPASAPIYSFGP